LRATLTQRAKAAESKRHSPLKGKFWRLAAEGKKCAIVAVAHALLVLVYQVLSQGKPIKKDKPRGRSPAITLANPSPHSGTWPLGINVGFSPQTLQPEVQASTRRMTDTNIETSWLFLEQPNNVTGIVAPLERIRGGDGQRSPNQPAANRFRNGTDKGPAPRIERTHHRV
jgi:hypothetical protein